MNNNEILRTGYEWMKYYIDNPDPDDKFGPIVYKDPDGFGERRKGRPKMTDKMTNATYLKCTSECSMRAYRPKTDDPWLDEKINGIKPESELDELRKELAEIKLLQDEVNRRADELRSRINI